MNEEIFRELEALIKDKNVIKDVLEGLKNNPKCNKIVLQKGLYQYYFGEDLIPILINYYENKIEKIDQKISNFKLSKIIY